MLLFLGLGTSAQELTIELENFNQAEITNGLNVIFSKSDKNSVKITGISREKVNVNVDNGILIIGLKGYRLLTGDDTCVMVFYTEINKVTANQNSKIQFSQDLKQDQIEFQVQQGSDLTVSLEVNTLKVSVATSATIIAAGKAKNQEIAVISEGKFQGENLKGERIAIEVSNNGLATISVKESLNATAKAGGTIFVYGQPENIQEKTTLGGSIKKLN